MKKIFVSILALLLLCGCTVQKGQEPVTSRTTYETTISEAKTDEIRSVWIAYYELGDIIQNCENQNDFEKAINKDFKNIKKFGFNTVTVQVRACCDAYYKSSYFPYSDYCKYKNGKTIDFDPLTIMSASAHSMNLKIEAWVNPYRVSQQNKIEKTSKNSIAYKWYHANKKDNLIITQSKIYFNPAKDDVTNLIVNGVSEICKNYNIDAIHFDDYFYPETDKKIDSNDYKKYQSNGGDLSLKYWRQDNINKMVKKVYKTIKSINKNIQFGISPQGNVDNNEDCLYADVETWVMNTGYIDYICPQIYYGFKNEVLPFMFTVKKWCGMSKCKIYIGLPLYKSGKSDEYASSSNKDAINEFKNNTDIISRQINYIRGVDDIGGFYIFSYSYLFENNDKCVKREVDNMKKLF